jgi:hypothetical protein
LKTAQKLFLKNADFTIAIFLSRRYINYIRIKQLKHSNTKANQMIIKIKNIEYRIETTHKVSDMNETPNVQAMRQEENCVAEHIGVRPNGKKSHLIREYLIHGETVFQHILQFPF